MEVSAKSGAGVKDAFMAVATKVVGERLAQEALASGRGKAAGRRTMRRVPGVQVTAPLPFRSYPSRREAEAEIRTSPVHVVHVDFRSPSFAMRGLVRSFGNSVYLRRKVIRASRETLMSVPVVHPQNGPSRTKP